MLGSPLLTACEMRAVVFDRVTEDRSADEVLDLVQRLDLIRSVLETTPMTRDTTHGA